MREKQVEEKTGIKVSQIVTRVTHLCSSDPSRPSFDGIVEGKTILWPKLNDRFRITFCPWCGLRLPDAIEDEK